MILICLEYGRDPYQERQTCRKQSCKSTPGNLALIKRKWGAQGLIKLS